MPNGKSGDNPLTDLLHYGRHPFPPDMEQILLEIDRLGRKIGSFPLGENWPFAARELDWERGQNLEEGRLLLRHFLAMLQAGRGDEILINPRTGREFNAK
jgi:hypothetical protein